MIGLEYILKTLKENSSDLAKELKLSRQNISIWFSGNRPIPKKYLPILREKFNIPEKFFQKNLDEINKYEIKNIILKNQNEYKGLKNYIIKKHMTDKNKYIEEFVKLSCASDLLKTYLFPNAKEITESFACYDAVRKHIWEHVSPRDDKVIFFAVGDGNQPRTAATFAYRSRWTCVSIDPLLSIGNNKYYSKHPKINRLYTFRDKVENIKVPFVDDLDSRIVVIGLVHSHAKINDVYDKLKGRETYIVSMPCCVAHNDINGKLPDIEYEDVGIWSAKNKIKIWKYNN